MVAVSLKKKTELLRNLANNSEWLARPELVEIVSGNVTLGPREQRRVSNFNIRVNLVRASEAKRPAGAASGASAPAAPKG